MEIELKIGINQISVHQNFICQLLRFCRMTDDHKLNSTMPLNVPTSREYGRFALSTNRHSSSPMSTPRDGNFDLNGTENFSHRIHSPRPMTRITDYLNTKPVGVQPYIPPSSKIIK
jgi:hypothetical protein